MIDGVNNAKITHTHLGREDHGIFTAWLTLDYGGSGQGFGGYALDGKPTGGHARPGTAYGCEFIIQILKTLEVEGWEKLPGTVCRVQIENGLVRRIGHFLKDQWFDPKALASKMGCD